MPLCLEHILVYDIKHLLVGSPFCSRFEVLGHMFILFWVAVRPLGKQSSRVTVAVNIGIIVTQSVRITGPMLLE